MKVAVLVLILLSLGVGGLVLLINAGGAAKSTSVGDLLNASSNGEPAKSKRVSLTVQVAELHSHFMPIEFDGIDIPPGEHETQEQTNRRFRESPRIRVVYNGHDKLALERYNHVRMDGTWDHSTGVFKADKLSTQCPSRYEAEATAPTVGS